MKLTPLDIHHKEFRHSIRGYSEEEVDAFLDEVADEFERLFRENIDLSEKQELANKKLREYADMEKTVHNTMVAAQRSAENIVAEAEQGVKVTRRDAEVRAKEIVQSALEEKQKAQDSLASMKQAKSEFRDEFASLLEEYSQRLREISAPSEVATSSYKEPVAASTPAPVVPVPEPVVEEESSPQVEEDPPTDIASQDLLEESSAEGSVTSVHLGEIVDENTVEEDLVLDEAPELEIPSFESLGERDDDLDIEEID